MGLDRGAMDGMIRGLTGKPRLMFSGCFSSTGCGHFQRENTKKNLCTSVAAVAFGYSWQVRATSIAHDTPPK